MPSETGGREGSLATDELGSTIAISTHVMDTLPKPWQLVSSLGPNGS